MAGNDRKRGVSIAVTGLAGPIWLIGWLFTTGYVHLSFWKAVLALVVWPYYLGASLR